MLRRPTRAKSCGYSCVYPMVTQAIISDHVNIIRHKRSKGHQIHDVQHRCLFSSFSQTKLYFYVNLYNLYRGNFGPLGIFAYMNVFGIMAVLDRRRINLSGTNFILTTIEIVT